MPDDYKLTKWQVVNVYCEDLRPAHNKLCICICPVRHWYFFINSEPPYSRKAKEVALHIGSFQLSCLTRESFIDTTTMETIPAEAVEKAIKDEKNRKGSVPPSLRKEIIAVVEQHGALTPEQVQAVAD